MTILGTDKVKELIESEKLIDGLDHDNLNIEGCGVDLRLGEVHEMTDEEGELLIETRNTPNYKLIGKYEKGNEAIVELLPGKTYSLKTEETINTPNNLMGWLIPRFTFYRAGLIVQGVRTDPGYKGPFAFTVSNNTDRPFRIQMGARFANVVFHKVDGATHEYIGQWQGGRTHIDQSEVQTKQQ